MALLEASRPLMQVATGVGILPLMLRNWRKVIQGRPARSMPAAPATSPMSLPADQTSEFARFKCELDRTQTERDVLN